MPEDRPDQETFEAGTSYRFGPGTTRKAANDGKASEPPSTAGSAEESAQSVYPAAASTHRNPLDSSTQSSTMEARSDTAGPSDTTGPPVSGLRVTLMNSPRPGDLLFGKYRVERLLGKGGMGEVWLVRHQILRDQFALKLIVPGAVIDEETVKRFVLEAQVMRALSRHQHAVVVHDADIDMDRHIIYIVMDVVHGCSIEKLLTPGVPMPLNWTTQVLGQLCDVLHQAHERGIVHRDLSPANLMLEDPPDGPVHLRVLDFGIAKVLDPESGIFDSVPLTENGRFFGKRSYASPEQINGARVDPRSDLYSIGVILYEFLTGYRPFQGRPAKLLLNHCSADPPRFGEINPDVDLPEVEQVVRRCLAKDPKDRPQSARELFDLFRAAVKEMEVYPPPELEEAEGEKPPVIAGEVLPTPPARRAWLTRRAAIIGFTVLVCLALAILVLMLTAIPPRAKVIEFLTSRELRPIPGIGVAAGGFPKGVERIADRRRLVWHQGVYLPERYKPDTQEGTVGALPRLLVRDDDVRFHLIQGGEFTMGAFNENNGDFLKEEKPPHPFCLSSFYMQRTEVSFGEFERFCEKTKREHDKQLEMYYEARNVLKTKMGDDEWRTYPAVGVPRKLAEEYAHYAGGELPSEAQWEYAARSGGKKRLYVSGDQPPKGANVHQIIYEEMTATRPVDRSSDDCTIQGVLNLTGNVREWCRDVWDWYSIVSLPCDHVQVANSDDANPLYVIRGGSYDTPRPETARVTWRANVPGEKSVVYKARNSHTDPDLGFRVVVEHFVEVPENLMAHTESRLGSSGTGLR